MPNVDRGAKWVTQSHPEYDPTLTVYPGVPPRPAMDIWIVEKKSDAPFDAVMVRVIPARWGIALMVFVRPRIDDREDNNGSTEIRTYHQPPRPA